MVLDTQNWPETVNLTSIKNTSDVEGDTLVEAINNLNTADKALQTNIDNEATSRKEADETLQANINKEATAREDADNALSDKIAALGSALKYKGSVTSYDDLPTDAEVGDVYNVEEAYESIAAGTNWAWTGSEWDPLGGSIDLSKYVTQEELDEKLKDIDVDLNYATDAEVTSDVDSLFSKGNNN